MGINTCILRYIDIYFVYLLVCAYTYFCRVRALFGKSLEQTMTCIIIIVYVRSLVVLCAPVGSYIFEYNIM